MRFGSSTREWPGVFFFGGGGDAAQKGVVCYVRRKTMRVLLLCWRAWRADRRLKDDSLCSLSLHGSKGRSSKVLVVDTSSAPVRSSAREWVQTRRTWKWWYRWVVQREHSFCSVTLLVWNPALSWPKMLARPVSPLPWPPWLGDLPSAVTDQKTRHFESALAFKAPAMVHAWSVTTKQTVWISWCRTWAHSTVTSQKDDDWCAVCGEDDGFSCWERNSCSCYIWQSPTNCHSTFAH